jgi:hypothetical protein
MSVAIEPFIPAAIDDTRTNDTAYPHHRFTLPLSFFWVSEFDQAFRSYIVQLTAIKYPSQAWPDAKSDYNAHEAMKRATAAVTAAGESEGELLGDVALYSNYALGDTPVERLYLHNLPRLRRLKKVYDPHHGTISISCFYGLICFWSLILDLRPSHEPCRGIPFLDISDRGMLRALLLKYVTLQGIFFLARISWTM